MSDVMKQVEEIEKMKFDFLTNFLNTKSNFDGDKLESDYKWLLETVKQQQEQIQQLGRIEREWRNGTDESIFEALNEIFQSNTMNLSGQTIAEEREELIQQQQGQIQDDHKTKKTLRQMIQHKNKQIEQKDEQIQSYEEVLKFYAHQYHYEEQFIPNIEEFEEPIILKEQGDKAKDVLTKYSTDTE